MVDLKRWEQAISATRGGGRFWKPKDGENTIRLFSYPHVVQEGDFTICRYPRGSVEVGQVSDELFLPTRKHYVQNRQDLSGPCGHVMTLTGTLMGDCLLCQKQGEYARSRAKEDQAVAKNLRANTKYVLNIVDLKNPTLKFQTWEAPGSIVEFVIKSQGMTVYQKAKLWGLDGMDLTFLYDSKSTKPTGWYTNFVWTPGTVYSAGMIEGKLVDLHATSTYIPERFRTHFVMAEAITETEEEPQAQASVQVKRSAGVSATKKDTNAKVTFLVGDKVSFDVDGTNLVGVVKAIETSETGPIYVVESGDMEARGEFSDFKIV